MQLDTVPELMKTAQNICFKEMNEFFASITPYQKVLDGKDNKVIKQYRDHSNKDALLFKPMPQVALFKAIQFLKINSDMDVSAIYRQANKIDYSYEDANNQWKNVVIASGGNILTSAKVEKLLERIFVYFIAGKAKCQKLPNGSEWLDTLLEDFKEQVENEKLTQLPEPKFK